MSNLLKETNEKLNAINKSAEDIIFIGSPQTGHHCTWEQFESLADFEYDSGYGSQSVATDLVIVFSDHSIMDRHEYDGSECWEYIENFKMPSNLKPIKSLGGDHIMWCSLSEINEKEAVE